MLPRDARLGASPGPCPDQTADGCHGGRPWCSVCPQPRGGRGGRAPRSFPAGPRTGCVDPRSPRPCPSSLRASGSLGSGHLGGPGSPSSDFPSRLCPVPQENGGKGRARAGGLGDLPNGTAVPLILGRVGIFRWALGHSGLWLPGAGDLCASQPPREPRPASCRLGDLRASGGPPKPFCSNPGPAR